jgi:hypothetical protein
MSTTLSQRKVHASGPSQVVTIEVNGETCMWKDHAARWTNGQLKDVKRGTGLGRPFKLQKSAGKTFLRGVRRLRPP